MAKRRIVSAPLSPCAGRLGDAIAELIATPSLRVVQGQMDLPTMGGSRAISAIYGRQPPSQARLMPAVEFVHHRVATTAGDQPPVHRKGGDARHGKREGQTRP